MRSLSLLFALGVLGLACDRDASPPVSSHQAAISTSSADPTNVTISGWDPDAGRPAWLDQLPLSTTPADPKLVARQEAFLAAAEQKNAQWQSAGRSEEEIQVLRAELKQEMLGE